MDIHEKNFPYKCFYSEIKDEFYVFYRCGHAITMRTENLQGYRIELITDLDLGQMELLFDEALVTRSSDKILFFK